MTEHVTDHVSRGVARLIERYRLPMTSALLASWLHEVQVLEDALWQLATERSVLTAYGATLDLLGEIVGQPREGRDDDTYRVWIAARMLVQRSSGTTTDILAIARKLLPDNTIVLREHYPAAFTLEVGGTTSLVGLQIAQLIRPAVAAGVRFAATWSNAGWPGVFTFAPADVPVPDSPMGFDAGRWVYASDGENPVPVLGFTFDGNTGAYGFDLGLLGG